MTVDRLRVQEKLGYVKGRVLRDPKAIIRKLKINSGAVVTILRKEGETLKQHDMMLRVRLPSGDSCVLTWQLRSAMGCVTLMAFHISSLPRFFSLFFFFLFTFPSSFRLPGDILVSKQRQFPNRPCLKQDHTPA